MADSVNADRIRMAEILLDDAVEQVEQLPPFSRKRRKQIAALRKVLEELRKEAGGG